VTDAQRRWERSLRAGRTDSPQPPADTIVACPLDEDAGNQTSDASGRRKVPVKGTAIWLPGKFGSALLLGGETYVDLGDAAAVVREKPFTVSVWVYPTTPDAMTILARQDGDERRRGYRIGLEDERLVVELAHDINDNAIVLRGVPRLARRQWQHLLVAYDGSGKAAGVRCDLNGERIDTEVAADNLRGAMQSEQPLRLGSDAVGRGFRGLLDDLRIYPRALGATESALLAGSDPIGAIVSLPEQDRSPEQRATLRTYYLEHHDPEFMRLRRKREAAEAMLSAVRRGVPTTMVMRDAAEPRPTYVLERGDYRYPGEAVTAGTPASLPPPPPDAPTNRLTLARWLVRPDHPLTARVAVNRYWQHFFGDGLVRTPENFGTRGEHPTHPELLDWLAAEFLRSGWDRKHVHRLIVTSATYRQSSRCRTERREADPENRLLARGPRFRLAAETLRDTALYAAGLLDERLGGPSVYPYQPKGLWKEVSFNPRDFTAQVYTRSSGADLYRRSLYTFWKRAVPPPPMAIFDAPNRETCATRRPRTNTPLQALVLMNEPGFVEATRQLAQRVLSEASSDFDGRLGLLFRILLSRSPTSAERRLLAATARQQRSAFADDAEAARQLLSVGEMPADSQFDPIDAATWTVLAGIVLNLDETINN
jgi:hypothetical protein